MQESELSGFWISDSTIGPEQINLVLYFYSEGDRSRENHFLQIMRM